MFSSSSMLFIFHLLFNILFSLWIRKLCLPWQSCLRGSQVTCLFYCSKILSLISKVILPFCFISGIDFCLVKYLPGSSIVVIIIQKSVPVQGVWPTLFCFWTLLGLTGTHVISHLAHQILVNRIQNKCRNNSHLCVSVFPGRISLKSSELEFKSAPDSPVSF